jgi:hypothetical protein
MKYGLVTFIAVLFLYSCTKSSNISNPPVIDTSSLVTRIVDYSPAYHYRSEEDFSYDSSKNLVVVHARNDDTSGDVTYIDSGTFYFHVDPTINLPTSYTVVYRKSIYPVADVQEHNLYYDGGKRVIKDSTLSASYTGGPSSDNYSYFTDLVVVGSGPTTAYDPVNDIYFSTFNWLDSLQLGDGNMLQRKTYYLEGSAYKIDNIENVRRYSDVPNPFYSPGFSKSLGAFLFYINLFDGLSKNLGADGGVPWLKDAHGRVISGTDYNGVQYVYTYAE